MEMYTYLHKCYGLEADIDYQQLHSVSKNKVYLMHSATEKYVVRIIDKKQYDFEQLNFTCKLMSRIQRELNITPEVYVTMENEYISEFNGDYMIVIEYIENDAIGVVDIHSILSALSLMLIFHKYSIEARDSLLELKPSNKEMFGVTRQVFQNAENLLFGHKNNLIERNPKVSEFMVRLRSFYANYSKLLSNDWCIIHADIHRENFLYAGSKATHIIDFDTAAFDTFYVDLASFLIWTCFMDENLKFHNVNQALHDFIIRKLKKKSVTPIQLEYLRYYVVSMILRRVTVLDNEFVDIIANYIENC